MRISQIQQYEQLSPLLGAQLRPGVLTNTALTPEDYRREIAGGTLSAVEFPGGLALLRRRTGFQILNFYLQQREPLPMLPLDRPTVLEIPMRAGSTALVPAIHAWQSMGFRLVLRRSRLTRPAGPGTWDGDLPWATPEDLPGIRDLLAASFDLRTGCLPEEDVLRADIGARQVLYTGGGVLRAKPGRGYVELRQLAVAEPLQGHGMGDLLVRAFVSAFEDRRTRVWAASDNGPALHLYEKHGFRPDLWHSEVYLYEKG